MASASDKALRLAIASPGVGRVQRGFERLFRDLYELVRDQFDVTLLKGGGPSSELEITPFFVHRNSRLFDLAPVHKLIGRTPYHVECLMYALAILPHLRSRQFDVVHTIDPPLTRLLFRLRARLGLKFKLLYTEGTAMAPSDYPPSDYTHFISRIGMDASMAYGHDPGLMSLLPCGIYPERFENNDDRARLRQAHGVPEKAFVILSVAAINRYQKRADYLIDEVAALRGDYYLFMDGSLDHGEPDLIEYAKRKLGDRVRIGQVPSAKVPELYRMADVMAHTSLFEAFGIAIVEAASTDLPLVIPDGAHFRWLIPNPSSWVNADRRGALTERLQALLDNPSQRDACRVGAMARARFDWRTLQGQYCDLYRKVADLPDVFRSEAECRKVL